MNDLPRIGSIVRLNLPGDIVRQCRILSYGQNRETVLVEWIDYALPDEWLPVRRLQDRC